MNGGNRSNELDWTESSADGDSIAYDTMQIMQVLPHRYPFLMIDKVMVFEDGQRVVAIKNVSANEPFFQGHFPGRPVMPGVLILEAMAQAGAILARESKDGVLDNKVSMLVAANDVRWKRQVLPGDCLRLEMLSLRRKRPLWVMRGRATVDDKMVAEATISAMEVD
ncbi:MAG: 3-hydroxyacyl-[acyl-carrier-protein] dehydratase FabZ [Proteobacteria bacterium]|nr:MAG: 3-hydroxyacyl-[acyl-carrier-protein] dehydratase FabZ [Pseudomonadota bacterium]